MVANPEVTPIFTGWGLLGDRKPSSVRLAGNSGAMLDAAAIDHCFETKEEIPVKTDRVRRGLEDLEDSIAFCGQLPAL
jgi:hypothetical protein